MERPRKRDRSETRTPQRETCRPPNRDGLSLGVDDRREAAIDHTLAVEGHIVLVRLHARVGHYLLPRVVADLLRRPFDPGIDDRLVTLSLHRTLIVGDLAVRDVVSP